MLYLYHTLGKAGGKIVALIDPLSVYAAFEHSGSQKLIRMAQSLNV